MPDENGFTDTADQDGPEPAEEECASEAAQRGVEEDSVGRSVGQKSGRGGEHESRKSTGKKNKFHDGYAVDVAEDEKRNCTGGKLEGRRVMTS